MRKIDEAKSILTLKKTVMEKLRYERYSDDISKLDEKSEITFGKQLQQLEENLFKVCLNVSLVSPAKYEIEVEIAGYFSIEEKSLLAKNVLEKNTVAILFPYLRSQLTLLTSQPGFEPVILPVLNINALMSDEDKE